MIKSRRGPDGIARVGEVGVGAEGLAQDWYVGCKDAGPEAQGFQRRESESLVLRQVYYRGGPRVQASQGGVAHLAEG